MDLFRSAFSVASVNFHRWKHDLRIWVTLLFITMITARYINPLIQYGLDTGSHSTPYLLSMLFHGTTMSIGSAKIIFYIGLLTILCDAPFFHPISPYMILRSRRNAWWLGECIYIIITAFLYMLFITIVSSILVLPIVTLENDWGSAIYAYTFGTTTQDVGEIYINYGYMPISDSIVQYVYPTGAQLYTFLTGWASFVFLGLLMYLISLFQKNVFWSIGVASFFILLEPILNDIASMSKLTTSTYWIQAFSPVCWSSAEYINLLDRNYWISFPFVSIMYPLLIILLMIAIKICSKKTIIELR